jgi:hypothetical protein
MSEKRTEPRLLCSSLVELTRRDRSRRQARHVVNLENISRSGACIAADQPLPLGTPILLDYADGQLPGAVRYSQYRNGSYYLGIRFSFGCKWSIECFQPKHLTDLQQLASRDGSE